MVMAALIVDGLFSAISIISSVRPTRADIFGSIAVDYKLFTNLAGLVIFAGLFWLTRAGPAQIHTSIRRPASTPSHPAPAPGRSSSLCEAAHHARARARTTRGGPTSVRHTVTVQLAPSSAPATMSLG